MRASALVPLLLLALAPGAYAQQEIPSHTPGPSPPREQHGAQRTSGGRSRVTAVVAIGERAPDFTLDAMGGDPVRLGSLRGGWVALFFCSRRDSLPALDAVARQLQPLGVRLLAISNDKEQSLSHYAVRHPLSFAALADPTGDISALYGLYDDLDGSTRPGFVLVDPQGNVRFAVLGQSLPGADAARLVQYAVTGM